MKYGMGYINLPQNSKFGITNINKIAKHRSDGTDLTRVESGNIARPLTLRTYETANTA